jgi:1-acyl-sn-glycerol-3-phosphate acyltransferase
MGDPADAVPSGAAPEAVREHVLAVVRALARETGGARAERAVAPDASLDREVGLGSLERVELLLRLERAFGRALDDRCLQLDTATALADALLEASPEEPLRLPPREEALGAATDIGAGVRTLQESLFRHARADPDRTHVFLHEAERAERPLSYGRLWREATLVAGGLRERGVAPGDAVSLMLPTGMDFLRSFLGILVARAVAVPIYPPLRLDRLPEYAARQAGILADAGARLLVTVPRARPVARLLRPLVATLREVVTADELAGSGLARTSPDGEASDPALIQYTSGSTGHPKGVLLTHENLLANVRAIARGVEARPTDVGVSWLPLYHDMGLIGTWLFCLHHGLPLTLMPPGSFLARPERWLWAIHRRRATLSAAPNFAYELCVRRIPDEALAGLDLSSWRAAFNGAEPVSEGTLERFARRFAPLGFRREAMLPAYGLAESSVALALPPVGRGPRFDRVARAPFEKEGRAPVASPTERAPLVFVSVGRALPDHEVRLVDDAGREVPERVVGRLVFRGPSTTGGYYRKPEDTAAMTLRGGWLDSGDLAYRAEGELYIAGRRKDLIIKAGRNLVPQEIEEAVGEVEGVRRGSVVAFGLDRPELGTEGLVVVAETRLEEDDARERLTDAVAERVAAAVEVPPDRVVLVPPGTVPKTSSGKVRRAAARQQFLEGSLGRPPRTTRRQRIRLLAGASRELALPGLRAARRALYATWLALALPAVVLPGWLVVALAPSRRLALTVGRIVARLVLRVTGCRLSAEGLELLPRGDPVVLVSNHASYADVVALMALLPLDVLFVAKREVLAYPVIGTFVRRIGHPTVDRADARQSVLEADLIAQALAAGHAVLFFPEGTFVAATGLRPFRLGAFKAAADAGVPTVPVALQGSRRVLRAGTWLPRPGAIHLVVCEPVLPDGADLPALLRLRDRVARAVAAQCGEPRLDLVAAGPEPKRGP